MGLIEAIFGGDKKAEEPKGEALVSTDKLGNHEVNGVNGQADILAEGQKLNVKGQDNNVDIHGESVRIGGQRITQTNMGATTNSGRNNVVNIDFLQLQNLNNVPVLVPVTYQVLLI